MNIFILFSVLFISLCLFGIGHFLSDKIAIQLYKIGFSNNEQKKLYDNFINFIKKFHLTFAIVLILIFGQYILRGEVMPYGILLLVLFLTFYAFFFFRATSFIDPNKSFKIGLILFGMAFLVISVTYYNYKKTAIDFKDGSIIIKSNNGACFIHMKDVKSIALVDELPPITKVNSKNKVYKNQENNNNVMLFINSKQKPLIEFSTHNGYEIYYSAPYLKNEFQLERLKDKIAEYK